MQYFRCFSFLICTYFLENVHQQNSYTISYTKQFKGPFQGPYLAMSFAILILITSFTNGPKTTTDWIIEQTFCFIEKHSQTVIAEQCFSRSSRIPRIVRTSCIACLRCNVVVSWCNDTHTKIKMHSINCLTRMSHIHILALFDLEF